MDNITIREGLLLLVSKTPRAVEAAKLLRQLDAGAATAERRAVTLIRLAVDEAGGLTDGEREQLRALVEAHGGAQSQRKSVTLRFRCTEQQQAAIQLLAGKYAGGNISRLILQTLEERYPTL